MDDDSLAQTLEKLSMQPTETTAPSIPAEIIQHTLSFLDPSDAATLPTLLACQLVSRHFAAASLAPIVWRPLVKARWEWGQLKYPSAPLPFAADRALVDRLFPSRRAPQDPFAVYRARTLLDSLVRKHIQLLVHGIKDRLVSIDTICALEECAMDQLRRTRVVEGRQAETNPGEHFGESKWAEEVTLALRRRLAVSCWLDIASGKVQGPEGIERGVLALSEVSGSLEFGEISSILDIWTDLLKSCMDRYEHLRVSNPAQCLLQAACAMLASLDCAGIRNTRHSKEEMNPDERRDTEVLDHRFLDAVITLADAQNHNHRPTVVADLIAGFSSDAIVISHYAYLALISGICRRLSASRAILVLFRQDEREVFLMWKEPPYACLHLNVATQTAVEVEAEVSSTLDDTWTVGLAKHSLRYFARDVRYYGRDLLHRAAQAPQVTLVDPATGIYAASIFSCLLGEEDEQNDAANDVLDLFRRPTFAIDVDILRQLLPFFPTNLVTTAQDFIRSILAKDAMPPSPQPRPAASPPYLKVGDFFLRRSSDEMGVVVGRELKPGRTIRALPRAKASRGDPTASTKPRLQPRQEEYNYLAITSRATPWSDLERVERDDVRRKPMELLRFSEVGDLEEWEKLVYGRNKHLGRYFEVLQGATRFFKPSAELKAMYPDG